MTGHRTHAGSAAALAATSRRCAVFLAFAALLAAVALVLPGALPWASASTTPSSSPVSGGRAHSALGTLVVKGKAPKTGYSRDEFGPAWADVDHNGCDTRNDVLDRDLSSKVYKDGTKSCLLASGTLLDPYTATRIDFVRGNDTSTQVQIDHVVALSNAWQTGAQQLSAEQRKELANDPYNLLAVDGAANGAKGNRDIATWQPPNRHFLCEYAARQVGVKAKYNLWVTPAEHDRFKAIFDTCPAQTIPLIDGVSNLEKQYLTEVTGGGGEPDPAPSCDSGATKQMYRMYNRISHEHLYTADANERAVLARGDWTYEGVGWVAPVKSSTPVWRLYNPALGDHHYTKDANEVSVLTSRHGWRYEGVGWYSDDCRNVPVYRQFTPLLRVGSHNYTADKHEYDSLNATTVWRAEGVAWYAVAEGWQEGDGLKPAPAPTQAPAQHTYVLNTSSKVIHDPSCGSVKQMKETNKKTVTVGSLNELLAQGYRAHTCVN